VRLVAVVALVVAVAGCNGGTVDRHALTNDASAIDSMNCEAALLANAVSRHRATVFFVREQAEELHLQASNLAHALSIRPTSPGLQARVRARARDARRLAGRLQELHDRPSDRETGGTLERAFKRAGSCP
jgi:predicted outer membrane protein